MEKLITRCIDAKSGYIFLSKLDKDTLMQTTPTGNATFCYNGKKYFFKMSATSGGVHFRSKEIFESLISKMLKRYTPTVEYYPAVFRGKKGVVCEHWSNLGDCYLPFHKALKLRKYEHAPRIGSVADFEEEYEDGLGTDGLKHICAKDCLEGVRKAPIQLMAGNYDFKLSNMAVQYSPYKKLQGFLSFDYGFNLFNLVDTHLKTLNMPLTKSNVEFSIKRIVEEWFYINLTMGATKNCCNYDDIDDLIYDFYCYAQTNKAFRENMKTALTLPNNLPEVFKEMEDNHILLPKYKKDLVMRVMDYFQTQYGKILY